MKAQVAMAALLTAVVTPVAAAPVEGQRLLIHTFLHAESPMKIGDDVGGIGDIQLSLFLSPSQPLAGWIVGAGPVLLYPSASDDALGGEKWGAGPTAVLARQDHGWTTSARTSATRSGSRFFRTPRRRPRRSA